MRCWTCHKLARYYTWAWFCSKKCEDIANKAADEAGAS